MSRFGCRCGYEIRNITCPSTHEGRLVTDMEIDDSICANDGPRTIDRLAFYHREFLECPECGRLWIQHSPQSPTYIPFIPEDGKESLGIAEQQGGYRG